MSAARALALAASISSFAHGVASAAQPPPPAAEAPAADARGSPAWRTSRWGMTVAEVVEAFPVTARRLDPPLVLADGNVVAVGIEDQAYGPARFRVRFVFRAGKLALVSLKTPETAYASPETYAAVVGQLATELGRPGNETKDDALVDLRQTRWDVGATRIDVKYIPGTVVLLYSERDAAPPAGAPARPPGPWAPAPRSP